jgi:hypothetical protein
MFDGFMMFMLSHFVFAGRLGYGYRRRSRRATAAASARDRGSSARIAPAARSADAAVRAAGRSPAHVITGTPGGRDGGR